MPAPPPSLRRVSTGLALAVVSLLLPIAAVLQADPASAAVSSVALSCTAFGQTIPNTTPVDLSVPTSAVAGSTMTFTINGTSQTLPTSQTKPVPVTVTSYASLAYHFAVSGGSVTGVTLSGGSHLGAGAVTAPFTASTVDVNVPGPIAAGTTIAFPTATVTVKVSAPSGGKVVVSPANPIFTLTPTVDLGGTPLVAPTTCTSTTPSQATASASVTPAPPVDTTAPVISVVAPAAGGSYTVGQSVSASYSCVDEAGGSGVASCTGPVASGAAIDTAAAGSKSFTVTAKDKAGNASTKTVTYTVVAAPPVEGPVAYTARGCTVPEGKACVITLRLAKASTQSVSIGYATRNITALAGKDYTAARGIVTFAPGEVTKSISVATETDVLCHEGTESFAVDLRPASGTQARRSTAVGRIADAAPDTAATTTALLPLLPYFKDYAAQLASMLPQLQKVACQLPVLMPLMLKVMPVMKPYMAKLVPLFPMFMQILPMIAPLLDSPFVQWIILMITPYIPGLLQWTLPILFG